MGNIGYQLSFVPNSANSVRSSSDSLGIHIHKYYRIYSRLLDSRSKLALTNKKLVYLALLLFSEVDKLNCMEPANHLKANQDHTPSHSKSFKQ